MENFSLSGAEKKKLRGAAQLLEAKIHVGKNSSAIEIVRQLEQALKKENLVKLRFHALDRKIVIKLCAEIEEISGATLISQIGKTASFYRPFPRENSEL